STPPPRPRPATMTSPVTQCTAQRHDSSMPRRSIRPRIQAKGEAMGAHLCDHITLRNPSGTDRPGLALSTRPAQERPMLARTANGAGLGAPIEPGARPFALARRRLAGGGRVGLRSARCAVPRRTESGLSITEGKPVTGAPPPLSGAQWQGEFAACRQSGGYRQISCPPGMTLAAYK